MRKRVNIDSKHSICDFMRDMCRYLLLLQYA